VPAPLILVGVVVVVVTMVALATVSLVPLFTPAAALVAGVFFGFAGSWGR
jgi:hypothetical protein